MDKVKLLSCLLDNEYHSGSGLAARLGVSRTVVWKEIKKLRGYGLEIEARHGKGYRLRDEIDLLDRNEILNEVGQSADASCLDVLFDTESTNMCLTRLFGQPRLHKRVVLAEYQHGGKGRRGRTWLSPCARGLCLSLGWRFDMAPASLNALSLASGVALARALAELNMSGISLKWPNDLILADKKVGGILLEARSETASSCDVAIGIGLNMRLDEMTKSMLDQPVTDLDSHCNRLPSRNRLAGRIIAGQFSMLARVAAGNIGEYITKWKKLDYLSGKQAELRLPGRIVRGHVKGVDENGLLLLAAHGDVRRFSSGEVSVRAVN